MKRESHRPIRTCLGCGRKEEKNLLRRVTVTVRDEVVWDHHQRLEGRGAYVCDNVECLESAVKRKAFSRSFRRKVALTNIRGM